MIPDSFDTQRMPGQIQDLLRRKDYLAATALLKDMERQDPENADTFYLLGVTQYFQGKISETIESLRKCLDLNPKHTDAAICLSVLFNDLGQYEEGRKTFDTANQSIAHQQPGEDLGVDRKFCLKHLELGDLYARYRRFDEAIEQYTRAMVLDPTDLEIRIRRAKSFAKKGFVTRAIQDLEQLKTQHPKFIMARLQLGLLHYSQSNILDAELEWETCLTLEPGHREALSYLEMSKRGQPSTRLRI